MKYLLTGILLVAASGCLPPQLDKYRGQDRSSAGGRPGADADQAPGSTVADKRRPAKEATPARATIYAVDKQTYRFALREGDVWETALSVLLRNYNLTIVDHQSGIISTEWDSFYLSSAVYRNKLSLRLVRNAAGGVDLTIHNNVERLRDAAQAAGTVGAVWLPAPDPANEVGRIVQNMALVLNQPPPVLPPATAVAKGAGAPGEPATR